MPDAPDHIVNRTTFAVTLGAGQDAFKAQARLADFFDRRLQPVLDQALSRYAPEGDFQIDRLEIDLGAIDLHRTDDRMAARIRAAIAGALQGLDQKKVVAVPPQTRLRRSFLAFLRTGQLPWDTPVETVAALEKAIRALGPEEVASMVEALGPLSGQPDVHRRLQVQFGSAFVHWLIEKAHPALPAALDALAAHQPRPLYASARLALLLETAVRVPPGSSPEILSEALRAQWQAFERKDRRPKVVETESTPRDADWRVPPAGEIEASEAADPAVFVAQAGVVLLHPFLPRFFDRCGLLTAEQQFADRQSREKAVHLLHFVATGQEQPEEPQTSVYKVLCGIDLHDPVLKALELAAADRNEALELLLAAIAHWHRLKNTSPDGLRSAFLQRPGILRRSGKGWHLTVEQQSIDILLGTLPWGLSEIRLSWLEYPLRVDWA